MHDVFSTIGKPLRNEKKTGQTRNGNPPEIPVF